jgi:Ni/Fe-hydrogenase subunit HybB-like protein
MWQRAQTIYLALVVVVMALTLILPFAIYPLESGDVTFNLFGLSPESEDASVWFPYYMVIALIIGLALFSVTQFKNRKRQLNLGKINYLLILGMVVMLFVDASSVAKGLSLSEDAIKYQFGMYMPVIAFAFTFLANRSIKKDEDLVKSVERLR